MGDFSTAIRNALALIASTDADLREIVILSLKVSPDGERVRVPFRTIAKLTLRGGRTRTIKRDKLLNVTFMSASSHPPTVRSDAADFHLAQRTSCHEL
jgi:hypothetical protein